MINIYEEIMNEVNKNHGCVIVTIINKKGSVPQAIGSTMVVGEKIVGTVGGGSLESNSIIYAKELLNNNSESTTMSFDLQNPPFNMICGGHVEMFFNVIKPKNKLYIFGSGHIASALSKVFCNLDFSVTFLDDREELLSEFSNTIEVDYDNLEINCDGAYIVVATRNHILDSKVVEHVIKDNYEYLGILGSKKKSAELLNKLEVNKTNIYSPIGLGISNQNPNEIAISIAAEILAHKNRKKEFMHD